MATIRWPNRKYTIVLALAGALVGCSIESDAIDCTPLGWDQVGSIGSEPDACTRVWAITDVMGVSREGTDCSTAIEQRCVIVSRGGWATVMAKMGSPAHLGIDRPQVTSTFLDKDGECPIRCLPGLAPAEP